MNRRVLIRIVPLVIAGLVAWYQLASSEKLTNDAGRTVRVALSEKQEEALGLQSYEQVLNQSDVMTGGREVDMVTAVARKLAGAVGESGHNFDWRVSVVRSPQVNAFCLPGGKIVVFTGILPVARTEAGLATVMGHEMAHATLRHGSERLLKQQTTSTLMTGVQFSIGDMSYEQQRAIMAALGAGAQYGYLLPFSRDHETEADRIGLMTMARAGYDPREAIAFWERMEESSRREAPPEFASTHPSHGTRIEQLKALMPQALALYESKEKR
jgi:predicted Zn-dependent protease